MAVLQPILKTAERDHRAAGLAAFLRRARRLPSADSVRGAALIAAAVAIPVASYLGCQEIAPLAALWGLANAASYRRLTFNTGALILLALVAIATAGSGASPYPFAHFEAPWSLEHHTPIKLILQWSLYGLAVAGVAQAPSVWARRGCWALAAGLGLALAADMIDLIDGQAGLQLIKTLTHTKPHAHFIPLIVRLGQSSFVLTMLFWPVAAFLARQGLTWLIAAGLWLALLVVLAIQTDMNAPILALGLSGLVYAVARFRLRICAWLFAGAATAYFLTAPWLTLLAVRIGLIGHLEAMAPASWRARLQIWAFASERIAERPLFGWGVDASRTFAAIPLHPHDGAIQLWLELGVLGACLAAAFWGWLTMALVQQDRRSPGAGAIGLATATAYLVIGAVSFGVWQEWWLATGALAFAACLALERARVGQRLFGLFSAESRAA